MYCATQLLVKGRHEFGYALITRRKSLIPRKDMRNDMPFDFFHGSDAAATAETRIDDHEIGPFSWRMQDAQPSAHPSPTSCRINRQ